MVGGGGAQSTHIPMRSSCKQLAIGEPIGHSLLCDIIPVLHLVCGSGMVEGIGEK